MELNKDVMRAVEALNYRVTVGDVAAKAGLNVEVAQQGLLALASETQGHMQVSDSGEIAYEFSRNFQNILRNKYWQLRLQAIAAKVWQVLFYIIRISFGVMLLLSIAIILIAILALTIAASSQGGDRDDRDGGFGGFGSGFGGGFFFFPTDIFWLFNFNYGQRRGNGGYSSRPAGQKLNFLEAIFSFLFGDGNPNSDLEDRRWRTIGTVISNNGGAITAEQVAPYLDDLGAESNREYEDYMLPVLSRFNGQPEVSPTGDIVYYFPELQVSAMQRGKAAVSAYLKEAKRKFTAATSGQVMLAVGLGAVNIVGALVLQNLFQSAVAQGVVFTGYLALVQSIFWLLLLYGAGFLAVPLVRYYWLQRQNAKIERRNQQREQQATKLNRLGPAFQAKLAFAQQFAAQKVLREEDSVYSTQTDLLEQESDRAKQIDADWQRRLNEI